MRGPGGRGACRRPRGHLRRPRQTAPSAHDVGGASAGPPRAAAASPVSVAPSLAPPSRSRRSTDREGGGPRSRSSTLPPPRGRQVGRAGADIPEPASGAGPRRPRTTSASTARWRARRRSTRARKPPAYEKVLAELLESEPPTWPCAQDLILARAAILKILRARAEVGAGRAGLQAGARRRRRARWASPDAELAGLEADQVDAVAARPRGCARSCMTVPSRPGRDRADAARGGRRLRRRPRRGRCSWRVGDVVRRRGAGPRCPWFPRPSRCPDSPRHAPGRPRRTGPPVR